ncbi:MAG: hypothetical protein JOZ19_11875 [Rubrobacter sp.]|nr:hypothetical protein [Rubrobacter sp.]
MPSSTLIRWGGLAAVVAGVLSIIVSLINLFALIAGQDPTAILVRITIGQIAGAVLLFGLVGLYFRHSDELGSLGLLGFVFAFFGTAFALTGNIWAGLLAEVGWALFGIACFQARVYPRIAAIVLIIGALLTALLFALLLGILSGVLGYLSVVASIIFYIAVAWLGFSLFTSSREETL